MNELIKYYFSYFRPNLFVKSIEKIDINALVEENIKLVVCDLDNTLVSHHTKFPNKITIQFIEELKKQQIKVLIASNNGEKRVKTFCEKLTIDGYVSLAWKPLKRKIVKAVAKYNFNSNQVLVIGDQFITDILLANRLGYQSILVLPIINFQFRKVKKNLANFVENYIYKNLQNNNMINEKSSIKQKLGNLNNVL